MKLAVTPNIKALLPKDTEAAFTAATSGYYRAARRRALRQPGSVPPGMAFTAHPPPPTPSGLELPAAQTVLSPRPLH